MSELLFGVQKISLTLRRKSRKELITLIVIRSRTLYYTREHETGGETERQRDIEIERHRNRETERQSSVVCKNIGPVMARLTIEKDKCIFGTDPSISELRIGINDREVDM